MKTIMIAILMMTALNVSAAIKVCKSDDHVVYLSADLSQAKVMVTGAHRGQYLAELVCMKRQPKPGAGKFDQFVTVAACHEPLLRDAGYSLLVTKGGFVGLTQVELSEVSFAGATKIDSLICNVKF